MPNYQQPSSAQLAAKVLRTLEQTHLMKPANNEALAIPSNFSEYLFSKYRLPGPLYNIVSPGNQVTASPDHTELHKRSKSKTLKFLMGAGALISL